MLLSNSISILHKEMGVIWGILRIVDMGSQALIISDHKLYFYIFFLCIHIYIFIFHKIYKFRGLFVLLLAEKMIDQEKNIDKLMQPDGLLSSPCIGEEADILNGHATFERKTCTYKNCSDRFELKEKTFTQQYSHIYAVRLMEMRKNLAVAARRKWGMLCLYTPLADTPFYLEIFLSQIHMTEVL